MKNRILLLFILTSFFGFSQIIQGPQTILNVPTSSDSSPNVLVRGTDKVTKLVPWSTLPGTLPNQSGHSGHFLTTNGSNPSWTAIPSPNLQNVLVQGNREVIFIDGGAPGMGLYYDLQSDNKKQYIILGNPFSGNLIIKDNRFNTGDQILVYLGNEYPVGLKVASGETSTFTYNNEPFDEASEVLLFENKGELQITCIGPNNFTVVAIDNDRRIVVGNNDITATYGTDYVVIDNIVITDPSTTTYSSREGQGYTVYVEKNTATIGGIIYSAGSLVYRFFDGTSWTSKDFNSSTPTGYAITKTDDSNLKLTLGGTTTNALLAPVSLNLSWNGTLPDSRISSSSIWNSKENALTFNTPLSRSVNAISIQNAVADNTTKGAASFTSADFDSSLGNISIDYTNGQKASASQSGFLNSSDWSTFNGKQANLGFTPENVANKVNSFGTLNNTLYPTTQAVSNYVTGLGYITSSALSPYLTSATASSTYQPLLGYTAENVSNKATTFSTLNNTLYPTTQAVSNFVTGQGYLTSNQSISFSPGAGDVTGSSSGATSLTPTLSIGTGKVTSTHILDGTIVNADINSSAAIDAAKIGGGAVSNTEFSYVDGVTSAIQNQLDNRVKYIARSGISGTAVTGTTSETEVLKITLPIGTLTTSDWITITRLTCVKTTATSTLTIKVKLSTTGTLPSGTTGQIATYTTSSSQQTVSVMRKFWQESGNLTGVVNSVSILNDAAAGNAGTPSTIAFNNVTTQYYLHVSFTLGSSSDSAYLAAYEITN